MNLRTMPEWIEDFVDWIVAVTVAVVWAIIGITVAVGLVDLCWASLVMISDAKLLVLSIGYPVAWFALGISLFEVVGKLWARREGL